MTTYNALDNLTMAENLRNQIILEIADLSATLEYEEATSTRTNPDDPDDTNTNYSFDPDPSDFAHLVSMQKLHSALNEYLRDKRQ